ncbi:MAG: hypothetical protein LBB14_03560 [Puniceicoccales bacterium]|nr:hypothetical protein [Puniceicoccales bacterium]
MSAIVSSIQQMLHGKVLPPCGTVVAVKHVTPTGTTLFTSSAEIDSYRESGKSFSIGALVLVNDKGQQTVVQLDSPRHHGNDVKETLQALGMANDIIDAVKTQHFADDFNSAGTGISLYQKSESDFVPITLEEAKKANWQEVAAIIHGTDGSFFFSSDPIQADGLAASQLGDGDCVKYSVMFLDGSTAQKKASPSSKTGAGAAMRVAGATSLSSGIGLIISLLTALAFNWATFLISIALIAIGIAITIVYEKVFPRAAD